MDATFASQNQTLEITPLTLQIQSYTPYQCVRWPILAYHQYNTGIGVYGHLFMLNCKISCLWHILTCQSSFDNHHWGITVKTVYKSADISTSDYLLRNIVVLQKSSISCALLHCTERISKPKQPHLHFICNKTSAKPPMVTASSCVDGAARVYEAILSANVRGEPVTWFILSLFLWGWAWWWRSYVVVLYPTKLATCWTQTNRSKLPCWGING